MSAIGAAMGELEFWPRFVLSALATWRASHLLAYEDGPADLVLRLRAWAGSGFLGRMLDCFFCLSLWVAAAFAFVLAREPIAWVVAWLALSGAACLLTRATDSSPS